MPVWGKFENFCLYYKFLSHPLGPSVLPVTHIPLMNFRRQPASILSQPSAARYADQALPCIVMSKLTVGDSQQGVGAVEVLSLNGQNVAGRYIPVLPTCKITFRVLHANLDSFVAPFKQVWHMWCRWLPFCWSLHVYWGQYLKIIIEQKDNHKPSFPLPYIIT